MSSIPHDGHALIRDLSCSFSPTLFSFGRSQQPAIHHTARPAPSIAAPSASPSKHLATLGSFGGASESLSCFKDRLLSAHADRVSDLDLLFLIQPIGSAARTSRGLIFDQRRRLRPWFDLGGYVLPRPPWKEGILGRIASLSPSLGLPTSQIFQLAPASGSKEKTILLVWDPKKP